MKNLLIIVALMLGVTHAPNLDQIQAMAEEGIPRPRNAQARQLAGEGQRVDRHSERRTGSVTEVTGEHVPYAPGSGGQAAASTQEAVDDCPCGADCKCPDPMVCKNGDCKRNYVIFFSAEWCAPCRRMYPRIEELRKNGYIVYFLDVDKYKAAAEKFGVKSVPTTVVMDQGKETHRFVGVVDVEKITSVTKKADEQTTQPESCDYNFL